ncbi:expressed unknown protein [Seminavis robusta]|uniref:ABM domain-containing protein n=1 Tax=Seminavis robusta TaxID=568900 RepID=A0A9N8DNH1_9STRA|nr:expressed unknown protein [Seminavis robusta]|eukprot:Sro259_g101390.1 n/a (244) ;mRNA; r:49165-49896
MSSTEKKPMVQGVAVFHEFLAKGRADTELVTGALEDRVHHLAPQATSVETASSTTGSRASDGFLPVRATLVQCDNRIVLVEEWESAHDYELWYEAREGCNTNQEIRHLLAAAPTTEYFPEALHIRQDSAANRSSKNHEERTDNNIGILVRQKTASAENGAKLRNAQREAYERQMPLENPGCTCCIILANSKQDPSQVRIIELWKSMQDFHVHETSDWHATGEEKVVPLVVDMDCDFVTGNIIL